jgi:hypothetical protein
VCIRVRGDLRKNLAQVGIGTAHGAVLERDESLARAGTFRHPCLDEQSRLVLRLASRQLASGGEERKC